MQHSRPIHLLSAGDLLRDPIWEYAMDEESEGDETYVRPVRRDRVPRGPENCVYHVACDVTAASGGRFLGFVEVCEGEIGDPVPIVVGASGEYWPLDEAPRRKERPRFEAFFRASFEALFPVEWTLRVRIEGESTLRTGRI
jgi:hypothetical protein